MSGIADDKSHSRVGRWLLGAAMLALLLGGAFWISLPRQDALFARDPRFVVTTRPRVGVPRSATLVQRAFIWWLQVQQRFWRPRPLTYSFPPSPTNGCSIHGLLTQCMEITGVRYVIARDLAAGGTVRFGHTNTLNGAQWVMAFAEALQTGQPEWWDSQTKTFRKENLVLLTNNARTVLVLPNEMAREFQRNSLD